jgi:hypothetical protein
MLKTAPPIISYIINGATQIIDNKKLFAKELKTIIPFPPEKRTTITTYNK